MRSSETRRVIFRHPRGIYETVEVTGEAFGEPYRYTETIRTPKRDERRMPRPEGGEREKEKPTQHKSSATAAEVQKIVRMYEEGNSILSIARSEGRAYAAISKILHENKVKMRRPGPQEKKGK